MQVNRPAPPINTLSHLASVREGDMRLHRGAVILILSGVAAILRPRRAS